MVNCLFSEEVLKQVYLQYLKIAYKLEPLPSMLSGRSFAVHYALCWWGAAWGLLVPSQWARFGLSKGWWDGMEVQSAPSELHCANAAVAKGHALYCYDPAEVA